MAALLLINDNNNGWDRRV